MKGNNCLRRGLALLVSLAAVLSCLTPAAMAEDENTIHIRTQRDWEKFTQNCRLDTWSQGKTVILERDLILEENECVPTFGGIFDGNGHTIRGLCLTGDGSDRGLFRYVQPGAEVKDLSVIGSVEVTGDWSAIGGIAGVNRGTIARCSFTGTMEGTTGLGGIAGVNEAEGEIVSCEAAGLISAAHYTGGIAGENYGSILLCTNRASVNTMEENASPELTGIDWKKLNSTENIPACTDTGGIAGYSKGVIQGCTNEGSIGYPHTGYNVGGIVGRQAGYVSVCTNRGTIQGRKDVGGIAGQMEPYTQLQFEEDTLQKLADALSGVQAAMEVLVDELDGARKSLSSHLTEIGTLLESAGEDVEVLLDEAQATGEGAIDTVNGLSARVSQVLERTAAVAQALEDTADSAGDAMEALEEAVETLETMADSGTIKALRDAMADLKAAIEERKQAAANLKTAAEQVRKALGLAEESREAWDALVSAAQSISDAQKESVKAAGALIEALGGLGALPDWELTEETEEELAALQEALEKTAAAAAALPPALKTLGQALLGEPAADLAALKSGWTAFAAAVRNQMTAQKSLREAFGKLAGSAAYWKDDTKTMLDASALLREGLEAMTESADALEDAFRELKELAEEQADQPTLELPKLSAEFHQREDSLRSNVDALSEKMKAVQTTADQAGDALTGNLKAVGTAFDAVVDVLREPETEEGRVQDISEEGDRLGTVAQCENEGEVRGDVNTGGIVGAMAVEFDFDPEDDIIRSGDTSLNFRYLTQAAVRRCTNRGAVTGRKDCVGGIAGRADLGVILGCYGYGSVESTSGNYVGGIAGNAASPIRESWAKCTLAGEGWLGGIAGYGEEITGCRSLVWVEEPTACTGAIAGEMDGTAEGNLFVSDSLGGIDGVSFTGKAEPVDYETMMELGAPGEFSSFTLTFTAEDEIIKTIPFTYGQELDASQVPAVPERAGFYAAWADFDRERLVFDRTIEAVYTPWTTTLSSLDGSVLVEGSFPPGAKLALDTVPETAAPEGELLGIWRVRTDSGAAFDALRIKRPENGRGLVLYRLEDGRWQKISCTEEGSYLRAACGGEDVTVCLAAQEAGSLMLLGIAAAAAALACGGVVLCRRKGRKKAACR